MCRPRTSASSAARAARSRGGAAPPTAAHQPRPGFGRPARHKCDVGAPTRVGGPRYPPPRRFPAASQNATVVRVVRPVDGRVDVDGHRARAHRGVFTGQTASVPAMDTQTTGTPFFRAQSKKGGLKGMSFVGCLPASIVLST